MGQNKKGYEYEDFVFKCFSAIYAWINNCPDLIKDSFKIKKGVKLPTYSGTTTNQIDIYIEYTQPGGLVVKTAVECKKRKTIEIDQIRDFNDKLRKIKNINGIFAYSGTLQQGVMDYAKEEDIKLWNIEALIKEIEITYNFLINELQNIIPYGDEEWCIKNNIELGKAYKLSVRGIKINDDIFKLERTMTNIFVDWLKKNGFKEEISKGRMLYTRLENNDRMYLIVDCSNDDILNNLHKIKVKKLEVLLNTKQEKMTQNVKLSNNDSLACIKDIITGKKQIVFASGKIK